ncbi:MAG TPA: DUF4333 domain-containing protein [Solirubrobacterales bacterium]|nr:DUF4333 domain-containing protein [Solirubrobacterales bacterium]
MKPFTASDKSAFPRISVASLAVTLAFGLAACGGNTIDTADLESKIGSELSADAGVDPEEVSVSCPEDIEAEKDKEFDCTLTAPNGDEVTVNVTLTDDEGGFDAVVPPQQFEED